MAHAQTQYFYTVEVNALEEQLSHSLDRVARLREKAIKRQDFAAAARVSQLQKVMHLAQHRIARLK